MNVFTGKLYENVDFIEERHRHRFEVEIFLIVYSSVLLHSSSIVNDDITTLTYCLHR